MARAQRALSVATGRTESPSEALALCCFDLLGVGEVQSQVEIADADGTVFARVDFLLRGSDGTQVVVEVDGAEKYSGSANGRGNALFDEKKREDRIRGLGYRVVRLTWADLMRPERVRKLLRQAGVAC